MLDAMPRHPQQAALRWPDVILDVQRAALDLDLDVPIYVVGGAVRDALLQRPIKDLDLATPGNAVRSGRRIANRLGGDFFVMDAERGVARILVDALTVDIAQFRGETLVQDLLGRDFTINAMAVDFLSDMTLLIDPLGGEQDALRKLLRRCTETSIADDPIRALRAVRQSVQQGMRIDAATQGDIRNQAEALFSSSPERVRDEFFAMLNLNRPAMALRVADALGLLVQILPEAHDLKGLALPAPHSFDGWKHALETVTALNHILTTISYRRTDSTAASFAMGILAMQLDQFRTELNEHIDQSWADMRTHRSLMLCAALLYGLGYVKDTQAPVPPAVDGAAKLANDLHLSNPEKKRLTGMIRSYEHAQALDTTQVLALHRYWYILGTNGVDSLLLALAQYLATHGTELAQDKWLRVVERAVVLLEAYFRKGDTLVHPPGFVDGKTLIELLGLEPGPLVGELLTTIREAQVMGEVTDRASAVAVAQRVLASRLS